MTRSIFYMASSPTAFATRTRRRQIALRDSLGPRRIVSDGMIGQCTYIHTWHDWPMYKPLVWRYSSSSLRATGELKRQAPRSLPPSLFAGHSLTWLIYVNETASPRASCGLGNNGEVHTAAHVIYLDARISPTPQSLLPNHSCPLCLPINPFQPALRASPSTILGNPSGLRTAKQPARSPLRLQADETVDELTRPAQLTCT